MPTLVAMLCCLFAAALAARNTQEDMLVAGDAATVGGANLEGSVANRSATKVKPGDACDCYPRLVYEGNKEKRKTKDGQDYTIESNTCCQEAKLICEPYMSGGECRVRVGEECSYAVPIINGMRTTYCAYGAYDSYGHAGISCGKVQGSQNRRCCIPNYGGSAQVALANYQPIYNEPTLMAKGNNGYMESCCSTWAAPLSRAEGYMFEGDQKLVENVPLCQKL
mmetsp:Transcript_37562/g.74614  ORF Transcript_37562/g.74614 Transcript_37562/m.74614 type:complete len:223 (-) Transcript_37562:39-707(-)